MKSEEMKTKTYLGVTLDLMEQKLPIVEIPVKPGNDYAEVILMGDLHVGSTGFSEHQLVAYIKWIKENPNVRVILMGDLLEMAELSNYTPEQEDILDKQIEKLISYVRPIKEQIICILEGTHEERYARTMKTRKYGLSQLIASNLHIEDKVLLPGPQKGQLVVLKVHNQYYPVYVIHGHTSAIFNKGTQLKRMAFTTKVPLLAHGHTHQIFHDHYVYRGVTKVNGNFYESIFEQHWLATGCFVKYLGYAEQASYPMTKIGAPIIRLFTKKENLMVIDDARAFYKIGMEYPNELCNPPSEADNEVLRRLKEELKIKVESLVNKSYDKYESNIPSIDVDGLLQKKRYEEKRLEERRRDENRRDKNRIEKRSDNYVETSKCRN